MVEWREYYAAWALAKYLLERHQGRLLLALLGDASKEEVLNLGLDGFVMKLDHTCEIKRGSGAHQSYLVPHALFYGASSPPSSPKPRPISEAGLELQGIHRSGRAVFLDFGFIYLKVCVASLAILL